MEILEDVDVVDLAGFGRILESMIRNEKTPALFRVEYDLNTMSI